MILIVDIDGTILTNFDRFHHSLIDIGINISKSSVTNHSASTEELVGSNNIGKFYRIFLSNKYLHLDKPIPHAKQALHKLAKKYHLVYLTGRHHEKGDSMRSGTLKWLKEHEFPTAPLYTKPARDIPDYDFKEGEIARIKELGVVAAIGDAPSDASAYIQNNIKTIILKTKRFKAKDFPEGIKIADNWKEIKRMLI
jgi:hypothetical protein